MNEQSGIEPLLFNKSWTAKYVPIPKATVCNDCGAPLPQGTDALVLFKNQKPRYYFCSALCQRRAAVTARVKRAQRWRVAA